MICDYEESGYLDKKSGKMAKLYRPLLTVNLIKRGFRFFPLECLLDSGADNIIFPADVARYFRINYKIGRLVDFEVAGGDTTSFYELDYKQHGIDIFVNDVRVKQSICFSEGQKDILLGQDFFKNFVIKFDRKNKKFHLN